MLQILSNKRHFPLTLKLKRGCGYVLLADHRKWPEFRTVSAKTISCKLGPDDLKSYPYVEYTSHNPPVVLSLENELSWNIWD